MRETIDINCDCGESFGVHDSNAFGEMMNDAKASGWRTFKRESRWHNACPACMHLWIDGMKQKDLFGL